MEQIKQIIAKATADAMAGDINPFDVFISLREIENDIKFAFDLIRDSAMVEAQKYHGQEYRGYNVNVGGVGGRYTYDHIPEYVELKNALKEMEKRCQESFKLSERMIAMVDDNGEQITPAFYKSGATAITLKAKKG